MAKCLGDINKHVWILDRQENWYLPKKLPPLKYQWIWVVILVCIPLMGWIPLWSWMDARKHHEIYVGEIEYWYCTRCRVWDIRNVPKPTHSELVDSS
jgi:hypothetical protein